MVMVSGSRVRFDGDGGSFSGFLSGLVGDRDLAIRAGLVGGGDG